MEASDNPQRKKMFLDIPNAAELAGFSIRHFRRIVHEDGLPIMQIGRKFFILSRDFEDWEKTKKPRHLGPGRDLKKVD